MWVWPTISRSHPVSANLPAGPASADRTICTLFVDIDRTFLQHWGGVHTDEDIALVKVRDWVADVEAVYSTRLPMLDFVAVGFKIHSSLTPFLPASPTGTDLLVFYQRWLATDLDNPGERQKLVSHTHSPPNVVFSSTVPIRGDGFLRPNNVCVNVLLAHVNVNGIVGAAYTGNPVSSIYGGICDNRAA